jgi:hypothetical protein
MGISLQAERKKFYKKKKKPDDRTGRCTKGKTTSSIPLFTWLEKIKAFLGW